MGSSQLAVCKKMQHDYEIWLLLLLLLLYA